MSKHNPQYDFKWCPGCGDFGVRRALDMALQNYTRENEIPYSANVIVAGIGCSGNMVHLLENEGTFGLHGIHGRTLPIAFGVKMGNPKLNVVVVAGDGDFLSIGSEHLGPTAQRNVDITCVIMDNAVYGLTKGQSSPTTEFGQITSSTPYGKQEAQLHPFDIYMAQGVSFIASHYSSKPRALAEIILQAMNHRGFSIVHVQSPCTTYNDTYELLKGNPKNNTPGIAWEIPESHDPQDCLAAGEVLAKGGIPLGVIFKTDTPTLQDRRVASKSNGKFVHIEEALAEYAI